MRILLFLLCAFSPLRLFAAVGDLVSLSVETNGWVARVTVESFNTNGMFYSGFRTNGEPTFTNMLTLNVTGEGYNAARAVVSVARTVYATKLLRLPYPRENTNDIQAFGSDAVFRIALSDMVLPGEVVTATARLGYVAVTNGTGTNAVAFTGTSCANNSVATNPAPFGKWASVPMEQITNATMRVKSSDWHWSGVAAVRFTAIDEHLNTNAANATLQWDSALRAPVYVADLDISSMTNGDAIQVSRTVYARIGTNTFTTTNGAHITSPYFTLTNFCDRLRQFGNAYALVDSVNGSASGVVVSHTNWNPSGVPAPFATIDQAAAAARLSNAIWFAHSDTGGAVIVLTNGSHLFTGGSGALGTNSRVPAIVTRHPSASLVGTIIGNQNGNGGPGYNVTIHGVMVTNNSSLNYWCNGGRTWWNSSIIAAPVNGAAFQYGEYAQYVTSCVISNQPQGWRGYSTRSAPTPLFAGNDCWVAQGGDAYCVMGNAFFNQVTTGWGDTHSSSPDPTAVGGVFAFNRTFKANPTSDALAIGSTNRIGFALVGNTHESTNNSGIVWTVFADGITNPATQILVWNNTLLGQRLNYNYNDTQVTGVDRSFFSLVGNFIDDYNIKSDTFNSSPAPSGNRIGNWASLFGVMQRDNVKAETSGIGASGFINATISGFEGMNTISSVDTNWPAFISRLAFDGVGARLGSGNYRLKSSSPLFRVNASPLVSHDLNGVPRGSMDAVGATASGNPKLSAFF